MTNNDFDNFTVEDSRKWGLIALAVGLVADLVLEKYISNNKALVSALFIALMVGTVRIYWRLRRHSWFWICIIAICCADVAIVVLFPTNYWPNSLIVLGIAAIIDLIVIISIVSVVESAIKKITRSH